MGRSKDSHFVGVSLVSNLLLECPPQKALCCLEFIWKGEVTQKHMLLCRTPAVWLCSTNTCSCFCLTPPTSSLAQPSSSRRVPGMEAYERSSKVRKAFCLFVWKEQHLHPEAGSDFVLLRPSVGMNRSVLTSVNWGPSWLHPLTYLPVFRRNRLHGQRFMQPSWRKLLKIKKSEIFNCLNWSVQTCHS